LWPIWMGVRTDKPSSDLCHEESLGPSENRPAGLCPHAGEPQHTRRRLSDMKQPNLRVVETGGTHMCPHEPPCPPATAPDPGAARPTPCHPEHPRRLTAAPPRPPT